MRSHPDASPSISPALQEWGVGITARYLSGPRIHKALSSTTSSDT